MLKLISGLLSLLLVILFSIGCSKKDNLAANTWTWNGYTFMSKKTTISMPGPNAYEAAINAMDNPTLPDNVLHIDFVKVPVKSGRLHISYDGYGDNEIRIYAYGAHGAYMSKADPQSDAYVYMVNGKVNLDIKNALLTPFASSDTTSIRLNAFISVP